jgi:hypothetical protein
MLGLWLTNILLRLRQLNHYENENQ